MRDSEHGVIELQLRAFYRGPGFWYKAYYLGRGGSTSLETLKRYVEQQKGAA